MSGAILQRLNDVFFFKIRIGVQNLGCCHPVSHQVDHQRDGDPHGADTGLAAHDQRIECDAVEWFHLSDLR
jgi:hypothetical protein